MKLIYSCFGLVLLFCVACGTTSKLPAWSPVGSYDYTVEDTPMGNVTGVLMIDKNGEGYTAKMVSPQGAIDMDNVEVMDKKLTCKFEFDGTPMEVEGNFEGTEFKGVILSGFGNFPLTATKKM